jgi:hypothetical protein
MTVYAQDWATFVGGLNANDLGWFSSNAIGEKMGQHNPPVFAITRKAR